MGKELINNQNNNSISNYNIDIEKIRALKNTIMPKNSSSEELELFIEYCKRTKLDPFARQIYAIDVQGKLSIQTSIDGFRVIAQRTGEYRGQEVFWCGEDGIWKDVWLENKEPAASKVLVYRKGYDRPISGIALWKEYNRRIKGKYTMWDKMPAVMLAKCAESLALRKAFPNELSGLYTSEEMEQANKKSNNVIDIQAENPIDNSKYDEQRDVYVINDEEQYNTVPAGKNKGKQWEELNIEELIKARDYYASKKPNEKLVNVISLALNEKLSICPTGISKGMKWIEMSTDKLQRYRQDYTDGKLIGYAEEYISYLDFILLEREEKEPQKKSDIPKVEVTEDEDPFSSANDEDWGSGKTMDELVEEQNKREKTPPHQVKGEFDENDEFEFGK